MNKLEQEKLQAKWERILEKRGLGIYQPMTDNSEGEMAQADKNIKAVTNRAHERDFGYLRGKVDGNDNFMDGHQIMKVRSMEREIPEWAMDDKEVRRILLTAFPKLDRNASQKRRAGQWARLIYLYYRMHQPKQVVGKELGINNVLLTRWIQKITFVAKGLNTNGKVRTRRHPSDTPLKEPERME